LRGPALRRMQTWPGGAPVPATGLSLRSAWGVTKRCYLGGFVTRLGDVDEPRPRQRNYDKVAVKGPGGLSGCWRPGTRSPFATRAPEVSRACRHSRGQGPGC